ncbi:MAG TPA: hypothetical protein VN721_05075 [Flavipsychrobacter sp.]|nr:hypothetical protein [Flavipsychrobacter sp.]
MKRIILLFLLCISFINARAAAIVNLTNRTNCSITAIVFTYDPASCIILVTGTPYTIGAGLTVTMYVPPSAAWGVEASFTSCPTPAIYTAYTTPCFLGSVPMPTCGCSATLTWTSPFDVMVM